MKTRFVLTAIFATGALVCGCGKETDVAGESDNGNATPKLHCVTVSAGTEAQGGETSTKAVAYESGGGYYWQKQDSIGVAIAGSGTFSPLALQTGSGIGNATFGGEVEGEIGGYAVYPYNKGHRISGDTLTYHLPSSYTYTKVDQKCVGVTDGITAENAINSANPPMVARLSRNEVGGGLSADFKHIGGVLRIKVDRFIATTDDYFLTVTADRPICGDFKVNLANLSNDYTPSISSTDAPDSSNPDNNTVTINFRGVSGQSGVFYIPLPVCIEEDGGYNLTVKLGYLTMLDKLEMSSGTATKNLSVERKHYKRVNITQATMYKGGYKVINGHKFIDLGLESGLLWAETNIGSDAVTSGGDYFEWGGLEPNLSFNSDASSTKATFPDDFFSGSDVLTLPDANDAARKLWHSSCRMPTNDEVHELKNSTNQSRTSRTDSNGNKADGWEFKSKTNGNSIFIQYNGYIMDGGSSGGGYGYYWTLNMTPKYTGSSVGGLVNNYSYTLADLFCFKWDGWIAPVNIHSESRFHGCGIRPVHDPNSK